MSNSPRKLTHKGIEYSIVGRRRLPCGHRNYRPGNDDFHGFDRTCDTCHQTYTGIIKHSDMLTEKCGKPTATIIWDDDPIQVRIQEARNETIVRKVKRARVGGASAPQTPLTPKSNVTRVGPPRKP